MADIDDLRGTPSGHTAKKSSETLKKAALVAAIGINAATIVAMPKQESKLADTDKTPDKDKIAAVDALRHVSATAKVATADFMAEAARLEAEKSDKIKEQAEQRVESNKSSEGTEAVAAVVNKINAMPGRGKILEDLGIEISYNKDDKAYIIENEENIIKVTEGELNHNKLKRDYEKAQDEKFSRPTEFKEETVDLAQIIQEEKEMGMAPVASYSPEDNSINKRKIVIEDKQVWEDAFARQYDQQETEVKEVSENKETYIAAQMEAIERLAENVSEQLNSPTIIEHEKNHRDDDKIGVFKTYDITPQMSAKLNMLTEIKSNMVEAGLALKEFRETGSLEGFDKISNAKIEEIKEELSQNPNAENIEQKIAAAVQKSWLEKNNVENSAYSEQAYVYAAGEKVASFDSSQKIQDSYSAAAKLTDSQALNDEYLRIVDEMFKDVPGLGDVRSAVNPHFELNSALSQNIKEDVGLDQKSEGLFNMIADGCRNVKQATRKIGQFLKIFKQADKDGERTETEQKKIDKKISRKMARLSGRIVNKTIKEVSGGNQQVKQSVAQTSQDISR